MGTFAMFGYVDVAFLSKQATFGRCFTSAKILIPQGRNTLLQVKDSFQNVTQKKVQYKKVKDIQSGF